MASDMYMIFEAEGGQKIPAALADDTSYADALLATAGIAKTMEAPAQLLRRTAYEPITLAEVAADGAVTEL